MKTTHCRYTAERPAVSTPNSSPWRDGVLGGSAHRLDRAQAERSGPLDGPRGLLSRSPPLRMAAW